MNKLILNCSKVFLIALLLSACEQETTYVGFAQSYNKLLFDSNNYDSYLAASKPQNSEFFYPCLEKNMARHHAEARIRIDACHDICRQGDAVCNLDCNDSKGTEYHEARRDLLTLKENTLLNNLDIETLKLEGFYLGEIECLIINTLRSYQGLPGLSCADIAEELKVQYAAENQCTFKKDIFKTISNGDWEIK